MVEYIATYVAITVVSLWLDRKRPAASPVKLFMFVFLVYYGLGAPLYEMLFPRQHIDTNYYYTLLGYSACLLSMLVWSPKTDFRDIHFDGYSISKGYMLLFLAMLGTLGFTTLWIWQIGEIPIFSSDIEYARTVKAEGTYHIRQLTTLAVPVYYMMLAVVLNRKRALLALILTGLLLIGCIALQGYRTFFVSIIAVSAMIAYRVRKELFNVPFLVLSAVVMFLASVAYGYSRYLSGITTVKNMMNVYEYTAQNFFIRTTSLQRIVEYFPASEPYQYGYFYLRGFNFLIPGKQTGPGEWLKKEVFNLDFAGDGFNPGIIGEFYLNFGVLGIIFGMMFYGFIITASYGMFARGKSPGKLVFGACAYFYILLAMAPGLATTIVMLVWYGLLIFFFQLLFRVRIR